MPVSAADGHTRASLSKVNIINAFVKNGRFSKSIAEAEITKNQLDRGWVPSHGCVHLMAQSLGNTRNSGLLQ